MYGYELRSSLEDRLGRTFSFGTVYPTLKRLAKQGAVEIDKPKGATSGRSRKIYNLTLRGQELFDRLLDEGGSQAAEDREAFMMRLAFFRYARPETRRNLLERRRGYLLERLDRMKGAFKNLQERVDDYSLELMRYGEDETTRELAWLDDRLAFEAQIDLRKDERKRKKQARKEKRTPATRREVRMTTDAPTPGVRIKAPVAESRRSPAAERG